MKRFIVGNGLDLIGIAAAYSLALGLVFGIWLELQWMSSFWGIATNSVVSCALGYLTHRAIWRTKK